MSQDDSCSNQACTKQLGGCYPNSVAPVTGAVPSLEQSVPRLALGPMGRKGRNLLGGAVVAVVPFHKDPWQRRPLFHWDQKEANPWPFRLSSLCPC